MERRLKLRVLRGGREPSLQPVEQRFLPFEDLWPGLVHRKPGAAVSFGDHDLFAGARRPLDGAGVADEGGGIEVALDRPRDDQLAGGLADLAEGQEVAGCDAAERRAGLLLELALGGCQGILAWLVLALGNRPDVLLHVIRAAGMNEEDLRPAWRAAVEKDSR